MLVLFCSTCTTALELLTYSPQPEVCGALDQERLEVKHLPDI